MLVRFFSSRAMLGICIVAMLLELPLRLLLQHVYFGLHVGLIQFTPDRADGLFAGAAVALYTHIYKRPVPKLWIKLAAGFGVLIVLVVVAVTPLALVGDGYFYTVGITAFALLSASLVAWSQYHPPRLQAWLTWRPLRIAGKYSYGMYVYHLFIYRAIHVVCQRFSPAYNGQLSALPAFCVIALAILLVTLIAKLSFELLERPLLGLKRFFPAAG